MPNCVKDDRLCVSTHIASPSINDKVRGPHPAGSYQFQALAARPALVHSIIDMGGEGRAKRDAMQGAKRSDAC
jgi:hypothetical protein